MPDGIPAARGAEAQGQGGTALIPKLCRGLNRVYPGGFGRKRIARIGRSRLPPRTRLSAVEVGGGLRMDLALDQYIDSAIYFQAFEHSTCRALSLALRPGDAFVDVGANIGFLTLLGARRVGPGGRVFAFEPNPAMRLRLERHLRLNGVEGIVDVHACGLADEAGAARLYVPAGPGADPGLASTRPLPDAGELEERPVELRTLDGLWSDSPWPVDLVKLDVEGGELRALRGAEGVLARYRPHVVCEYNPATAAAFDYEPTEIARLLLRALGPCRIHLLTSRRIVWNVGPDPASLCRPKVENWWFQPEGRRTC